MTLPAIHLFGKSLSFGDDRAMIAIFNRLHLHAHQMQHMNAQDTTRMAPFPPKDDASNLGASLKSGSGLSSVTGMSSASSKRMEDAKHLSKATTQATLAAKSILLAGGNDDAALKVAKAAAQATLLHACIGTADKGGPATFLSRRKIKRQSEIVASMALVQATNDMYSDMQDDANENMRIQKMSIAVDQEATAAKPSPLTIGTRPLSPLAEVNSPIASDTNDDNASADDMAATEGKENVPGGDDDAASKASETSKVSRLSMSSAPLTNEKKRRNVPETIKSGEENKSSEETADDTVQKKASSMSESSLKPKKKPLNKGALSLDASNDNVEVIKEDSDDETKENSSPKETPTLVVAPSPKADSKPQPKQALKLLVSPTRPVEPQAVASPVDSVKANLIRKKTLPKSVFTPSNTYYTEGMESREEFQRRYNRAPRNVTTPMGSPVRVSYVQSPRNEMDNDDDDATFGSEPIYIVEREGGSHEDRNEEMRSMMMSSSEESSFFSAPTDASEASGTYDETKATYENKMDPIASLFASMLKCGAGFHNMNKDTMPDEDSVRHALKNSQIIVNTTIEDQDDSVDMMNRWDSKSPAVSRMSKSPGVPRSPAIRSQYDPRSPASRISAKFQSMRPSNTPRPSKSSRGASTPRPSKSRTSKARSSRGSHFGTDEKSHATEHTKSIEESGSSGIMYNHTRSSEASRSSGSKRSKRRPKHQQAGWKRALGLKPSKPKRRNGPRDQKVQTRSIEPTPSDTGFEA